MAFCTSCGSAMDDNAVFCTKCGNRVGSQSGVAAAAAPARASSYAAAPPAAQPNSGGALKIILIILAILVILGVIMAGVIGYAVYRVKKNIHVYQQGGRAVVNTPFGNAGTLSASEAAQKIGVDLYPGAQQEGEAATAAFGSISTVTLVLTTNDSIDQVSQFYRQRYPNGFTTTGDGKFSLMSGGKGATLTISAEESAGRTKISIAKVTNTKKANADE